MIYHANSESKSKSYLKYGIIVLLVVIIICIVLFILLSKGDNNDMKKYFIDSLKPYQQKHMISLDELSNIFFSKNNNLLNSKENYNEKNQDITIYRIKHISADNSDDYNQLVYPAEHSDVKSWQEWLIDKMDATPAAQQVNPDPAFQIQNRNRFLQSLIGFWSFSDYISNGTNSSSILKNRVPDLHKYVLDKQLVSSTDKLHNKNILPNWGCEACDDGKYFRHNYTNITIPTDYDARVKIDNGSLVLKDTSDNTTAHNEDLKKIHTGKTYVQALSLSRSETITDHDSSPLGNKTYILVWKDGDSHSYDFMRNKRTNCASIKHKGKIVNIGYTDFYQQIIYSDDTKSNIARKFHTDEKGCLKGAHFTTRRFKTPTDWTGLRIDGGVWQGGGSGMWTGGCKDDCPQQHVYQHWWEDVGIKANNSHFHNIHH